MDFARLFQLASDVITSNTSTSSLPSTFLESFIPGYGITTQIILRGFGIDLGRVAGGVMVLFGLYHALRYCKTYIDSYVHRYFTSTISIDGNDPLYKDVMDWAAQQRMTRTSRDLRAQTKPRSTQHDSEDDFDDPDDKSGGYGIFNCRKRESNVSPRYEPNYGVDRFVHEGRTFYLSRERKDKKMPWWGQYWDEFMNIRCKGRSTTPIKNLLLHIRQWTLKNEKHTTSIYRPSPKKEKAGDIKWDKQSNRASRPMRTVSLGRDQKKVIVSDINEYLQPETRRWYNARGIPYRRGYLFHGPPGTGKTSLSFALAGIFGLHIYCISLSEVGLTEADLNKLFRDLPRRCIVLLEDIDSAGLRRDDEPLPKPSSPTVLDSKAPAASDPSVPCKSLISLSGLLNVIDGVASHEGRVLIMTTNHPEHLDEALTRPGRVDVRIPFALATRNQIKDIFTRMYGNDVHMSSSRTQIMDANHKLLEKPSRRSMKSLPEDAVDEDDDKHLLFEKPVPQFLDKSALERMAQAFADEMPEVTLSPAAIQGYLLTRKREPRRALDEACAWRDEQLSIKGGKGK